MDSTLSFRFANGDLNRQLISLLKAGGIRHSVDEDGVIHYAPEDEARIENDLIRSIRERVFPSWQVLSCPSEWAGHYRQYMLDHEVPFREEWIGGQMSFLLPRSYRPHRWKLALDATTAAR